MSILWGVCLSVKFSSFRSCGLRGLLSPSVPSSTLAVAVMTHGDIEREWRWASVSHQSARSCISCCVKHRLFWVLNKLLFLLSASPSRNVLSVQGPSSWGAWKQNGPQEEDLLIRRQLRNQRLVGTHTLFFLSDGRVKWGLPRVH